MATKLRYAKIPRLAYGGVTFYDNKPVKTIEEQQAEYNKSIEQQNKENSTSAGLVNAGLGVAGTVGGAWGQAAVLSHAGGSMVQNAIAPKDEYGVAGNDTGVAAGQFFNPAETQVGGVQKIFKGQVARGLIDTFLSPIGAGLDNRDARRKRDRSIENNERLTDYNKSLAQISNYPIFGNADVSFYNKMGGRIPCYDSGGKLLAIGSGAKEVIGRTHEQGGVDLLRGNKPVANVEDNEVLYGDKVYSARLPYKDGKTFADHAKTLAAIGDKNGLEKLFALQEASKSVTFPGKEITMWTGGKVPKNPNEINIIPNGDPTWNYESNMSVLNRTPGNMTFDNTGSTSVSNNVQQFPNPKYYGYSPSYGVKPINTNAPAFPPTIDANGNPVSYNPTYAPSLKQEGTKPDYLNNAAMVAPYIRAGANAIINANRPPIPTARMEVAPNLQTNYDINPALANLNRQQIAANIDIDNNSSNSATSRNAKLAVQSGAINSANQLYNEKTNQEVNLKNQKATSDANTANRNLAKLDNADAMRFAAQVEKQNATSENISNTTDTFLNQNRENNQYKLDQSKIKLTSQALAIDNPAGLRQGISDPNFRKAWESAGKVDDLKEKMSTEQASVDEWNKYYPNNPTSLGWKKK